MSDKNCESCNHLNNKDGGYCYMFGNKPDFICRLNTNLTNEQRAAIKSSQFGEIYGSVTGRMRSNSKAKQAISMATYLIQDMKATNMMMQMDFAKVEQLTMASMIKCKGDCPLLELAFPTKAKILTAQIRKVSCGGTAYSADCPYCGKTKILGSELNTMSALCEGGCYGNFNLEMDS